MLLPASVVSLALLAFLAGGMAGLLVLDRVARHGDGHGRGEHLLPGILLLVAGGIAAFLAAPALPLAVAALFLVGLGAAPCYPIAKAAAYRTRPGRSGTVLAVEHLGAPFETALPGIVGLIAGHFGLGIANGCFGLAPLAALLVLPRSRSHAPSSARWH